MRLAAALAAVLVIAVSLAAWKHDVVLEKILYWRYWQTLPPAAPGPAASAGEANRRDLDYLARLPEVDRSFTPETRAEYARRIAALRARADQATPAELLMGVAHAAAAARNGHTQLDPAAWRERLASSPVRFAWLAGELRVVRAMVAHRDLLGARVLSIAGGEPEALLEQARPYVSGTPERARALSPLLLESPEAIAFLRPGAPPDRLLLRVRDAAGVDREVALAARAPGAAPAASKPGRVLAPEPIEGEGDEWLTALAPAATPESLKAADRLLHTARIADGVLYLHPWRVSRGFNADVGRGIDAALGGDGEPPWRRIVLDLRFDDGGEYPMVYRAIRRIPGRLAADGRLAILTDETTYSGAIIVAALAKSFGSARARVIGSRAGDGLAFWAEGTHVDLPHSRLRVHIATGWHDWANGCRELRCYWPNFVRGVAVGGIEPDVAARWRFDDYARGFDPVVAAALE